MIFRKATTFCVLLLGSLVAATNLACDKDDDDDDVTPEPVVYTLSGEATGTQEVPSFTTTATGNLTGTYNADNNIMNFSITWTGLSSAPSAMHFHGPASPGVNASVLIPITGFTAAAAGSVTGSDTLTSAEEGFLFAGKLYYNIHTPLKPGGEIRGQVVTFR